MTEEFYTVASPEDHVPGIPSAERIWTEYRTKLGDVYYLTSKRSVPGAFWLYRLEGDRAVKLGKGDNPVTLEKRFINSGGRP